MLIARGTVKLLGRLGQRGTLNVCAVKAPGFGDRRKAMMEDLLASPAGDSPILRGSLRAS